MAYPELVKLEGTPRELSKKANKALRAEKKVPAVLYGPEIKENVHFSIDELQLERILRTAETKLQELTVDGKVYKTLLKRTEYDPVTDRPIHADFYVLAEEHKVTLRVPIHIVGVAAGVVEGGGRMFQPMKFIRIRVLPKFIISHFDVDIAALQIGNSFHVGDLNLEGIIPLDALTRTIVTIRPPKVALVTEEDLLEDEEGATEEGAEGAPAEETPSEE